MSLGQVAKLYYGTAGGTANVLVGKVRTVNITDEAEAVESKYRDSNYVSTDVGTRKLGYSITMKRDPANGPYAALRALYLAGTTLRLKSIPAVGSAESIDGDYVITKWNSGEDMDSPQETEIEAWLNLDNGDPTVA